MSSPMHNEKIRRPLISFTEGLRKAAGGKYREKDELVPWLFRALVVAVDPRGGHLETEDGKPESGSNLTVSVKDIVLGSKDDKGKPGWSARTYAKYEITPTVGPRNPRNSIRARITSQDRDKFIDDDTLRTFWPLFPDTSTSLAAGEMVYVIFEDEHMQHGLWLGRVPNNVKDDQPNLLLRSKLMNENLSKQGLLTTLYPDRENDVMTTGANPVPVKRANRISRLFLDFK